jgi:hypothetical protein
VLVWSLALASANPVPPFKKKVLVLIKKTPNARPITNTTGDLKKHPPNNGFNYENLN